jgi:DNA transformation protein and related proteins
VGNRLRFGRRRRLERQACGRRFLSPDHIRELFTAFGAVTVKRMFGGAGIYAEGRMFALVHEGVIYLKADTQNAAAFEREDLLPFTYKTKAGRRGVLSYRRMPERLYDDPEELAAWARAALAAARRATKGAYSLDPGSGKSRARKR